MAKTVKRTTTQPQRRPVQARRPATVRASAPAPAITTDMVDEMQAYRFADLEKEVPVKTRSDFQSDEEYRTYLLDSYNKLRHEEYEYVVRNETMKVYNLACDGKAAVGNKYVHVVDGKRKDRTDNNMVWNGYQEYINLARTPEEKERRRQQVADCAICRAPGMASTVMNDGRRTVDGSDNLHCCAITSSSIAAQVSGKMGYDNKDNLVVPKYRGDNPGRRNNIVGAAYISQADSIQNQTRYYPEMIVNAPAPKEKTLNDRVRSGELGIGDSFAIQTSTGAGNNTTGCHAMTIADIVKDDQGKVVSYVLQANNTRCLTTVNVNDSNNYYGSKPIKDIVKTSEFVNGKIKDEVTALKDLPIAELEARVVEQRGKTEQVITDLAVTERYNVEKRYNTGIATTYKAELDDHRKNLGPADELMGKVAPEMSYTAEERESVRQALLGMDMTSFEHMQIAPDLKADRAAAEAQFESSMAGYFAEKGKGDDKKSMKLASELLSSFMLSDEPDKSLDNFHKYVENATKSNENLNMILMNKAREGR